MDDLRKGQLNLSMAEEQISDRRKTEDPSERGNMGSASEGYFSKHTNNMVSPPAQPVLIDAEGLQKTLQGLTNMALAHEIALNKDFKLKKPDRSLEPVSPGIQAALDAKEKYWGKVDEILMNKDIKECKHTVLDLVHTLKTMLHSTMLPHNVKMKEKIDQELDMEKIQKQIDNDAFDFVHYMDFILDSLAALCCPIRDQEVVEIRNIDVPSRQVRKTIDLMENMNLDMANFIISQSRSHIVQNCVTYERNKFASFVDLQYRMGNDPIKVTRDWILRHTEPDRPFDEAMAHAFLEILDWDDKEWPESLALDWVRFPPIRKEIQRVTIIGALVASIYEYSRTIPMDTPENPNDFDKNQATLLKNFRFLTKLRDELNIVISCEDLEDQKKLEEALERCCIQAVIVVDQHRISEGSEELTAMQKGKVVGMIRPLIDPNHPVRVLYYRRVKEWFLELAKEDGKGRGQPPQNLSIVSPLVIVPITEMMRLSLYSRGVFDVLYKEIFDGNCPPPTFYPPPSPPVEDKSSPAGASLIQEAPMDQSIANLLAKLQGITDKSTVYEKATAPDGNTPPSESAISHSGVLTK